MKNFIKKHWFYVLIGIFIVINAAFLVNNFVAARNQKIFNQQLVSGRDKAGIQMDNSDFYDQPCPEITLTSVDKESINLRDLIGNVIIIKFSRFYRRALPDLIYLEHLAGKFKDEGTSLIFVNSLGKHHKKAIGKICEFSYPIIEDNGSVSGIFNASPEDIIIIDRNFSIRFKYPLFNKSLIHNTVVKWLFDENTHPQNATHEEMASKMAQLSFYDVLERKEKKLSRQISEKKTVLTLFTSTCTACEENYRINLLKEASSQMDQEKMRIIFLFGIGNNAEAIRQFAILEGWDDLPITVGVIRDLDEAHRSIYYDLFLLDTDPRTFILGKKGEVIFAEDLKNSKSINMKFLARGH